MNMRMFLERDEGMDNNGRIMEMDKVVRNVVRDCVRRRWWYDKWIIDKLYIFILFLKYCWWIWEKGRGMREMVEK